MAQQGGSAGGSGTEVTLPALGESVTEGTVSRWLKQVGESVAADEPLLEISTDKVDTEIPSPTAGVLLEIRVQEDETVEVGAVLAVVGEEGAAPSEAPDAEAPEPETATETGGEEPEEQTAAGDEGGQAPIPAPEPEAKGAAEPEPEPVGSPRCGEGRGQGSEAKAPAEEAPKGEPEASYVTPLVRKLAREHNVELSSVTGTGVGGRIRKQDVLAAAEEAKKAAEAPAPRHRRPLPPPQPPHRRPRRPRPARCAGRPRRCPGCARPLRSAWSSRCRSRRSSPPRSRSI